MIEREGDGELVFECKDREDWEGELEFYWKEREKREMFCLVCVFGYYVKV